MEKILDLTMITDIFPTGYHGCIEARVGSGSTVYIAGGGPVGLAAATAGVLPRRRGRDRRRPERGRREHAAASAVRWLTRWPDRCPSSSSSSSGYPRSTRLWTASGSRRRATRTAPRERGGAQPGHGVTRAAGGIGIPALRDEDPGSERRVGPATARYSLGFGIGWAKSLTFATEPDPTMRYNRQLREAILNDQGAHRRAMSTRR